MVADFVEQFINQTNQTILIQTIYNHFVVLIKNQQIALTDIMKPL